MKKILLSLMFIFSFSVCCMAEENAQNETYDWEPLLACIIHVESKGNPKAKNGDYVGVLQISTGMVKECNNILRKRGSSKRFSLADRYNAEKSKEMFVIFQSRHNPSNNVERAIRSWNGGARYTVRGTQRYYEKVMNMYKKTDA
ncbi:MAG: lytic transglycosylase domain-containing protein [Prevotella sp.]|nr:lytic transglycosylase domain-containing protein [Candidatus Equicola faecalis]